MSCTTCLCTASNLCPGFRFSVLSVLFVLEAGSFRKNEYWIHWVIWISWLKGDKNYRYLYVIWLLAKALWREISRITLFEWQQSIILMEANVVSHDRLRKNTCMVPIFGLWLLIHGVIQNPTLWLKRALPINLRKGKNHQVSRPASHIVLYF